jgi:hypothetical protein
MMPNILEKLVILSLKSESIIGKENYKTVQKIKKEIDNFLNREIILII